MGRLQQQIIPTRFLLTTGHFLALLMVTFTKDENVTAAVGSESGQKSREQGVTELDSAIIVGLVCFLFDFLGMFYSSLFMHQINMIQIFLHFLGGVLVSSFIKDSWPYTYMWLLVAFFNIPSALIEIGILAAIHLFQIVIF